MVNLVVVRVLRVGVYTYTGHGTHDTQPHTPHGMKVNKHLVG